MSSETVNLQNQSQNYDKTTDKKEENSSSDKAPPTDSPASSSNGPLTIEKPNLDMILRPPNSPIRKSIVNLNA